MRGSISVNLLGSVRNLLESVTLMDFAVPNTELRELHDDVISFDELEIRNYDAIFLMNNHERNKEIEKLLDKQATTFVFDGWGQLNKSYVLNNSNLAYVNMGFSSFA